MQVDDSLNALRQYRNKVLWDKRNAEARLRQELQQKVEREVAARLADSVHPVDEEFDFNEQLEWVSDLVVDALKKQKLAFDSPIKLSKAIIGRLVFEGIVINEEAKVNHEQHAYQARPAVDSWTYEFKNYMAHKPRQ